MLRSNSSGGRDCGGSVEARDLRPLVDDHPALEQDATQSADEPRGLDGGAVAHESAAAKGRRRAARLYLGRGELSQLIGGPGVSRQRHHVLAQLLVRTRGDRVHVATASEPRVDVVPLAEFAERRDARRDGAACLHRLISPVQGDQAVKLVPPATRESSVPAARAAAADVLLQHDHAQIGIALGEEIGGPEPAETAADDDNVCLRIGGQRRARPGVFMVERLAQPPAPLRSG